MTSQEIINLYINELFQTKKINVDSTTVGDLRRLISKKFGFPSLGLQIILEGKVLIDESKTLKECNYDPANVEYILMATTSPESKISVEQIFKDLVGCITTPIEKKVTPEMIKSIWKQYP